MLFDSLTTYFYPPEPPSGDVGYARTADGSGARRALGLPDGHAGPVYALFQHSKKLHPDMDAALRGILDATAAADGRVLVLAGAEAAHAARWRRTLGAANLARVVFVPRMPRATLLALVEDLACCFLDTFPWGAGVTSLEAFALGVPVVTLPAKISVLQLALGQYRAMGLGEDRNPNIADDVEGYVAAAARLGLDPVYREAWRLRIVWGAAEIFEQRASVDEWARFVERAVHGGRRGPR